MFLTRKRLKKVKRLEDDDILHYLKYSHLEPIKEDIIFNDNKDTQYPDIINNFTQTKPIQSINTAEKGVDTGNDFDEVTPPYVSLMYSEDFDKNDKMVQVWTKMIKQNLSSSPSSSSSNSSNNSEGFLSKTARRGFRLAEFALDASLSTAQIAQSLWNATSPPEYDINNLQDEEEVEEVEEEVEASTSSVDDPHISRDRSRSRDSSDLGDRLLQRGASRSRSITPSSTPASSAKTTPRKKNN